MSWVIKHSPKNPEDLLLSQDNYNKIHNWLTDFKEKKTKTNCLFLYGGTGSGKTACAHTFLKKFNYNIVEFNSSDITKKTIFSNKLNDILYKKNIINMFNKEHQETAIIMDEIDGINLNEKYVFNELINSIFPKQKHRYLTHNPFILISSSLDKKQKNIIAKSLFIELKHPSFLQLENLSMLILDKEKKNYTKGEIKQIIDISVYDIRQVIINLEYYKNIDININKIKYDNKKNIEIDDYKYINTLYSRYTRPNNYIIENKNILYMIFYENFVNFIISRKEDKNKYRLILKIYKHFSDSDIYDKCIYKKHMWDLIDYNYYYKLITNSFCINNSISINNLDIELKYSSLLNKYSLEFINIKLISNIIKNCYNYTKSLYIQDVLILLNIYYEEDTNDSLFRYYRITKTDIKKTLKFI